MLEYTSRMRIHGLARPAHEIMHDLSQALGLLNAELQAHAQALRFRGMCLPLGTQQALRDVQRQFDALTPDLNAHLIELRQLRALTETSGLVNSALEVDVVLERVMDTVIQLTGAERGVVLLRNPRTGQLEARTSRGLDRERLSSEDSVLSQTVISEVLRTGKPVLTDNAARDNRFQDHDSVIGLQLLSILAVPLMASGETLGVLYCDNRIMSGLFKAHEMSLLQAFSAQAAVAIQNARLFEAARARLAEIREMRDLMDRVFASLPSGIITLDAGGVVTAFNPAAELITGANSADIIGRVLPAILPDFAALIGPALARVMRDAATEMIEAEVPLHDTGWRLWRVLISPLRAGDGAAQGAAMVLDDLTEEREREARLRQARSYLPLALVDNLRSEDIASMGGQERTITVMVADVRGFTSFSEHLQPEDLMQIINRYLSLASDAINAHDGIVDKYIGDAVSALFNTPLNPQPNHTLRAVLAALDVHEAVSGLHPSLPEEQRLRFGIGIHTGQAVLGNIGASDRREFSAIGDAVDLARLLQANAGRGEIMLSAAAKAQVDAFVLTEPATPTKTGDRADFTEIYRVLGRREGSASTC